MDLVEMLETNQIARLAAMGTALRPDWQQSSLYTLLARNCSARTYRDVAVALAYVAADPATNTPARLIENGPWWNATRDPNAAPEIRPMTCPDCGQIHTRAQGCQRLPDRAPPERVHQILAKARAEVGRVRETLCRHGIAPETCQECGARQKPTEEPPVPEPEPELTAEQPF